MPVNLREEVGKLIKDLMTMPREKRTPPLQRLLDNLLDAVADYDREYHRNHKPERTE